MPSIFSTLFGRRQQQCSFSLSVLWLLFASEVMTFWRYTNTFIIVIIIIIFTLSSILSRGMTKIRSMTKYYTIISEHSAERAARVTPRSAGDVMHCVTAAAVTSYIRWSAGEVIAATRPVHAANPPNHPRRGHLLAFPSQPQTVTFHCQPKVFNVAER